MTRLLLTVALLIVLIVIAYIIITVAAAAIMRHGRHVLREDDADLQQPSEAEVGAFLEGLPPWDEKRPEPRPGMDIYTDHTVRLPWTPPADLAPFMPPPAWTPTTAELDDMRDRWADAQGRCPCGKPIDHTEFCYEELDDGDHAWCGRDDVLPEPDGFLVYTGDLGPALAERLASDTDVRTVTSAAPDVASVLPDWVIKALNGHNGVDAAVDSIVARAANDA